MRRIGYLIPEFPGQTHIFFWREHQILKMKGIEPEFISTRRPPAGVVSHDWAQEAIRQTTYLFPPDFAGLAQACRAIARAAPMGWARCLTSIARAYGVAAPIPWKQRARLAGLVVMGARLAETARTRDWTHVHCHSCADAAHIAMFAHLLSGLPYSLTLHGTLDSYGPNQREKWRHAALGIAVTELLRRELERQLPGALPERMEVAPMGVDTERFRRQQPQNQWQGNGPFRIFSCGRLNQGKGHQDLVKAVALMRHRGIDARLVVAGEDDAGGSGYRAILEAEIDRSGMRESVTLLGATNESGVIRELQQAHVFALASHAEAIGVAIMEAMAMEVPVVVTSVGGVSELVQDGIDGLFVPPAQPAAFADALARVAQDSDLASRLGRHGRSTVEEKFQATRSAEVLAGYVLGNRVSD